MVMSLATVFTGSLASAQSSDEAAAAPSGGATLNPDHPDRYVVRRGDTLWAISGLFLRNPWYWPEIWYANPQVENPHLIYPGDVLSLVYVDGQPRIQLERGGMVAGPDGTVRLSPQVRTGNLDDAITTIPYEAIAPFLTRGMVLQRDEIADLPYVAALREGHMVGATGNDAYVRGKLGGVDSQYNVVHVGDELVDPDDGEVLGYEGVFVAEGALRRDGDPATLRLSKSLREALVGDRLVAAAADLPLQFQPSAPAKAVDGSVMHVVDGVGQFGQFQVVALNRGSRDGLAVGNVLTVWQQGGKATDRFNRKLFARKVQLPDEEMGTVMVFRTYDRMSYALVMQSAGALRVLDKVRNPG
jgi:hypothetical protein